VTFLIANCVDQCHAERSNVSNSADVDQCQIWDRMNCSGTSSDLARRMSSRLSCGEDCRCRGPTETATSNSASVDQCQVGYKPSRPGGGLVLLTEVPQQTERGRSIATETRFPRDVRSSLNFRHNVAGARTTLRAMRWGNRPTSLWIAEDFGCCASG
jgi:hypothetical protein